MQKKRFRALPAKPDTVAEYVKATAEKVKPSTLRRRLVAAAKLHQLAGHTSPTDDEAVNLEMWRAKRSKPARPRQAMGVTAEHRDRLMAACPDTLSGLREGHDYRRL